MKARISVRRFFLLGFVIVYANSVQSAEIDPACLKWFEANTKKIIGTCALDCPTFMTDMDTFQCPERCNELCGVHNSSTSKPGGFLFYPGLTKSERELVDKNPKEAIIVFIQKTKAELSSTRHFPDQGFNVDSRRELLSKLVSMA